MSGPAPDGRPGKRTGARLICCIVPAGDGLPLATALYERQGLLGIDVIGGRGASQRSRTFADEVDVLTVTVAGDQADAAFAAIYELVDVGAAPHRFMFQVALDAATVPVLPELPQPDA